MQFTMYAPPYAHNSGGARVLYNIVDALRKREHKVNVVWKGSQIENVGIVIYPEIISGNPLNAKHVVRLVLNRPGNLGGDKIYDENELVFIHTNRLAEYVKNKIQGVLFTPSIERDIFYDTDEEKILMLCYEGKGKYKDGYFKKEDAIFITATWPPKRMELAELFRKGKILYCFDPLTAVTNEAVLCGCPVVIIPDDVYTKEAFDKNELGTHGVSWNNAPEEVQKAKDTVKLFAPLYDSFVNTFDVQLDSFLNIIKKSFGE